MCDQLLGHCKDIDGYNRHAYRDVNVYLITTRKYEDALMSFQVLRENLPVRNILRWMDGWYLMVHQMSCEREASNDPSHTLTRIWPITHLPSRVTGGGEYNPLETILKSVPVPCALPESEPKSYRNFATLTSRSIGSEDGTRIGFSGPLTFQANEN